MKEFSKRQEEKGIWLFGDEVEEKQQDCAKFLVQTQHLLGDHHLFEGNRNPNNSTNNKKKRSQLNKIYHRHTDEQIQQMEEVFKECQHPDEMTRRELSRRVALEPVQIKFWFQNKRTQIKNAQERKENQRLRAANELLLLENNKYKEALKGTACFKCASSIPNSSNLRKQLMLENHKLRQEIARLTTMTAQYKRKPSESSSSSPIRKQSAA